jgi:hypothetical protein
MTHAIPLILADSAPEMNAIFGIPMILVWIIITIQTIMLLGSLRHLVNAAKHFLEAKTPPEITQ